jgi:hypothetical protein
MAEWRWQRTRWSRLPAAVQVYLGLQMLLVLALIAFGGLRAVPDAVVSTLIAIGIALGSRAAWWLAVIAGVGNLLITPFVRTWPFQTHLWIGLIGILLLLALLMSRPLRQHCSVAIRSSHYWSAGKRN